MQRKEDAGKGGKAREEPGSLKERHPDVFMLWELKLKLKITCRCETTYSSLSVAQVKCLQTGNSLRFFYSPDLTHVLALSLGKGMSEPETAVPSPSLSPPQFPSVVVAVIKCSLSLSLAPEDVTCTNRL